MANTVFKSDISLDAAFEKCSCVAAPPNDRDKRRAVSETPPPPSMLEKRTTEMFAFGQEAPRIPSPRFPVRPGTGAAKQIYNVTEELVRPTSGPNSAQMSAFDAYSALPQQPYAPQHPVQQPQRHYTSSQYDGQSSSTRAYSNPPGNEPARQVSASKESSQLFPSPSQLIEQLYQQPATPNVTVGPPRYETPKIADIPDQKYEYYPEPQQATTSDVYYTQQVTVPTQAIPQEFQQQQMVLPIQPPPPFSLVSGMSSRSSGRTHVTSNQDTPTIILGSRPITPQPCNPQKATFVIPVPTATICELKIENESTLNCLKGARESHRRGFFSTGSHSRSASTTGERGSGTNTIVEGEWHTVSAELKIDSLGGRLEVRVKKLSLCSEVHGWPLKGTHVEESGFNVGSIGKQYVIRVSFLNGRHIFLNFAGAETKMQWWVILKDLTCRFK
ncbi:hypothetical protein BC830DRAFT_1121484 [Chytriomyces sp. MP71]|nr:hypothetical protein BC830DRAFT_1121484 [Chytriomyces sp. MP71]